MQDSRSVVVSPAYGLGWWIDGVPTDAPVPFVLLCLMPVGNADLSPGFAGQVSQGGHALSGCFVALRPRHVEASGDYNLVAFKTRPDRSFDDWFGAAARGAYATGFARIASVG